MYLFADVPSILQTVELLTMSKAKCTMALNEPIGDGKLCAGKPPGVKLADVCEVCSLCSRFIKIVSGTYFANNNNDGLC